MNPHADKPGFWKQIWSTLVLHLVTMLILLVPAQMPAHTYNVLHNFNDIDGRGPNGELLLSGGVLFGTASLGSGGGKVFRINPDGSDFVVLKTLDGQILSAGLTIGGEMLYGATYGNGGDQNPGFIFRISKTGTDYTVLKQFQGTNGAYSQARLVLQGSTLYGTTAWGGSYNIGTVFRIDIDGGGFNVLHHFNASADGRYPWAGLALSQGVLYGTTAVEGGVFKINADGSGFAVVTNLGGSGLSAPYSGVTLSGTKLYGTTYYGGVGFGTVFGVNTDGSELQVLKYFSASNQPYGGVAVSGGTIYGTTMGTFVGGDAIDGYGSVFRVSTNGSGYEVLKNFTGGDGANPQATLLVVGSTLYGTTKNGGSANKGTVFSLVLDEPPVITSTPPSQTAELGSMVYFNVRATGTTPISYQWFRNETDALSDVTTNSFLRLTNIQYSQSGAYSVVLTNVAGAVTSAPATLNVVAPVERRLVPGIEVTGSSGSSIHLDYSEVMTSFPDWRTLGSLLITNPREFCFDLSEPLPPQRFYQAWVVGIPTVVPSLALHMVPAITLTGTIGSAVRVDGINAIGPTDAWSTLATVTLTNTSQSYFDISALSQPRKLYRIIPVP